MQASVHRCDLGPGPGCPVEVDPAEGSSAGACGVLLVTDEGVSIDVSPVMLARSGLRGLRVGQRLTIERDASGAVTRLDIPGLSPRPTPAPTI